MIQVDRLPEEPEKALAEEIARQIRERTEQTADAAKARFRAMAAQYSHLGPEVDTLLAEALDDFGQAPAYLESVFRHRVERMLGKNEELENVIVVNVEAVLVDDPITDSDTHRETTGESDGGTER